MLSKSILTIALTSLCLNVFAQKKDSVVRPDEKVYIAFDRASYKPGDSIFFKAYLFNRQNILTEHSRVLYLDLFDPLKKLKSHLIIPLTGGTGSGEIWIDSAAAKGNYLVRAYTNWMRNFNDENFFYKNILLTENISPALSEVHFFPESGKLVENRISRVAFTLLDREGRGIETSGLVLNSNNDTLAVLKSRGFGMGIFSLKPLPGETYYAVLNGARFALPAVVPEGYVLTAKPDGDAIVVNIGVSKKLVHGQTISLALRDRTHIYGFSKFDVDRQDFNINIPVKDLPKGVVRILLTDDNEQTLAERLIFNSPDSLTINASHRDFYRPSDTISIAVQSLDKDRKPVLTSLLVSIGPGNGKPVLIPIQSQIMLSELKQASAGQISISEANLFLMTQTGNYRLPDTFRSAGTFAAEHRLDLVGKINPAEKNIPVELTIASAGRTLKTLSLERGEFRFDSLELEQGVPVLVSTPKGYSAVLVKRTVPNLNQINPSDEKQQQANQKQPEIADTAFSYAPDGSKVLKEVRISETRILSNSRNLNGPGNANYILKEEDIKNSSLLSEAIRSRVPGIEIREGKAFLPKMEQSTIAKAPKRSGNMTVYLDGVRLDDFESTTPNALFSALNLVNVSDVESVEFLTSPSKLAVYGSEAFFGAILINTKSGSVRTETHGKNNYSNLIAEGYTLPTSESYNGNRNTVYWNPNVMTTDSGKASVKFIAPAKEGIYRAIIEGVDGEGRFGYLTFDFEIKK